MLNPDLQKDIDLEIDKAPENIKTFLRDKYFADTISLIERVNKLNEDQSESVELEIILNILKISDYENIEDAIKNECGIDTETEQKQVAKDIKDYIFDKLNPIPNIAVVINNVEPEPLRNIIQDAYGKDMMGPKVLDYYEDKRNGGLSNQNLQSSDLAGDVAKDNPLASINNSLSADILSGILEDKEIKSDLNINTNLNNNLNILNTEKENISNIKVVNNISSIPTIKNNDISHDVYRELPDESDIIMKREIDVNLGKRNEDDIIRGE